MSTDQTPERHPITRSVPGERPRREREGEGVAIGSGRRRAGTRTVQRGTTAGIVAAVVLAVSGVVLPAPARAADNAIGCGPSRVAELIAAVDNANATPGADILALSEGCTYSFSSSNQAADADPTRFNWYGPNALPAIASTITIEGNGATIERSSAEGTPKFRLFYIGADATRAETLDYTSPGPGNLTLRNLTVRGGLAKGGNGTGGGGGGGMGGAVFSQGLLTLDSVTMTANTAQGGSIGAGSGRNGGGIGTDASGSVGGGFGPGTFGGASGGSAALGTGGGGGGGFRSQDTGADAVQLLGGAGGGPATGSGGPVAANLPATEPVAATEPAAALAATSRSAPTAVALASGGSAGGGGGAGGGGVGGGGGGGGASTGGSTGGGGGFGGGGGGTNASGTGGFGGGAGAQGEGGFGGGGGGATLGGGGAGMGGAVFNHQGVLNVVNATLAANVAMGGTGANLGSGFGGAIFNLNGSVTLTNATVAANAAATGGGALYNLGYDSAVGRAAAVTLTGGIVADSAGGVTDVVSDRPADTTAGANHPATVATVSFSGPNLAESVAALGTGTVGAPTLSADPNLAPTLAANAAPDRPQTLALRWPSPAIDAAGATCVPVRDQRGVLRPALAGCDLGAFEARASISVTPANPSVARGATQQFTATGSFDDGTQADLTGSVTWASSGAAATVGPSGLASGQQVGSTTISAARGTSSGSTTLAVNPTDLVVQGPQSPRPTARRCRRWRRRTWGWSSPTLRRRPRPRAPRRPPPPPRPARTRSPARGRPTPTTRSATRPARWR